jgi:ribosomal protein L12E/L44/L45/RPP1/RPP2
MKMQGTILQGFNSVMFGAANYGAVRSAAKPKNSDEEEEEDENFSEVEEEEDDDFEDDTDAGYQTGFNDFDDDDDFEDDDF